MKNKLLKYLLIIIVLLLYIIIGNKVGFIIKCPINYITNFYCPGCGVTRMISSILKLNFYQAFRYNQFVFILTPFIIILFIDNLYSEYKNKTSLYKKIPNKVYYLLIILLIIYGILRNFIPYLAPTQI